MSLRFPMILIYGALALAFVLFAAIIALHPDPPRPLSRDEMTANQLRRELTHITLNNELKCLRTCNSDFCTAVVEQVTIDNSEEIETWQQLGYYQHNSALLVLLGIRGFAIQQLFAAADKACHKRGYRD